MATTLKFLILGDDKASAAFNSFSRSVENANKSVTRHNASLKQQGDAADSARGRLLSLTGTVTGFGDAAGVANGKSSLFARSLAALNLATGVLEPALAGAVVAAGGLAAATAAAGAGAGAYGLALKPVLTQVGSLIKLQDQAATGSKAAQEQLNAQLKSTPPAITAFAKSVTSARAAYTQWGNSLAKPVLAPLQTMLGAVRPALEALRPLVIAAAGAFGELAKELSAKIEAGGLDRVVSVILPKVRPVILDLGHAVGNLVTGIWDIAKAFLPVSTTITGGVVNLTARFREWAAALPSSTGFQSLMRMFTEQAPAAGQVLGNLIAVIRNIAAALAGLTTPANSTLLLNLLLPLTSVMAALSANQGLVQTVSMFLLFRKALGPLVPALSGLVSGFRLAAGGTTLLAGGMNALRVAFAANPVGLILTALALLAAALIVAWQRSETFRDIVKGTFHEIGMVAGSVAIVFLQGIKFMTDGFLGFVGSIVNGAARAFGWVPGVGGLLKGAADKFNNFRDGVNGTFNSMISSIQGWQRQQEASQVTSASVTAQIMSHFSGQKAAADSARSGIDQLSTAIEVNGAKAGGTALMRQNLINDMVKAGVNATTARADVDLYTNAVAANGANSDAARGARTRLITDLAAASQGAAGAKRDIDILTTAVQTQGATSDAARGARAQLIKDLQGSGVSARDAASLVDGLIKQLGKVPANVSTRVSVTAAATGALRAQASWSAGEAALHAALDFRSAAAGMLVSGGVPGKDSVLAMLMPGEVVVPTAMVRAGAVDHLRGTIPGFAAGGAVDPSQPWQWMRQNEEAWAQNTVTRWMKALQDAFTKAAQAAAAAAVPTTITAASAGTAGGVIATMMRNMAAARGWTGAQWNALYQLEMREAGFSMTATNPTSGAYGLAQGITGPSWYYQWPGGDPTTAQGQVNGMLAYIASRYGTPAAAWAHEVAYNWYANGGRIPEAVLGVGASGRRYAFEAGEEVQTASAARAQEEKLDAVIRLLGRLIDTTAAVPAGVGRHVGAAVGGAASDAAYRARYPRAAW